MNKEVKRLWLEALRSGEYDQGTCVLRRREGKEVKHCCLGVLCELAKEHSQDSVVVKEAQEALYTELSLPPSAVVEWSGLQFHDPLVNSDKDTLVGMNDGGSTFAEIADVIEREL